jgi:hypothetical protein
VTWPPPPACVPSLTAEEVDLLDSDMRRTEWLPYLAHAVAHIRWLHPTPSTSAIIETRVLPSRRPCSYFAQVSPIAQVMAAQEALRANAAGKNAFVAVNARDKFGGKKIDVAATTSIMLDLDAEKLDITATLTTLASVGIEPSMLVVSGRGLHFYVRLAVPMIPAIGAEPVWRRLSIATHSDRVFDCCRIARLAGSINHKQPSTTAYVAGIWPDRVYSLEALSAAAGAMGVGAIDPTAYGSRWEHKAAQVGALGAQIPNEIPSDVEAVLRTVSGTVAEMIRTGERPSSYTTTGNSELDFRIMCAVLQAGHSVETLMRLYSTTPVGRLKAWRAGQSYFRRTLGAAMAAVSNDRPHIVIDLQPAQHQEFRDHQQQQQSTSRLQSAARRAADIRAPFPDWDESIALPRPSRN